MSSDLGLKWTVSECPATQETTSRLRLPFFWRHMKLGASQRRENGGYRSVMRDLLTGTEVVDERSRTVARSGLRLGELRHVAPMSPKLTPPERCDVPAP